MTSRKARKVGEQMTTVLCISAVVLVAWVVVDETAVKALRGLADEQRRLIGVQQELLQQRAATLKKAKGALEKQRGMLNRQSEENRILREGKPMVIEMDLNDWCQN